MNIDMEARYQENHNKRNASAYTNKQTNKGKIHPKKKKEKEKKKRKKKLNRTDKQIGKIMLGYL